MACFAFGIHQFQDELVLVWVFEDLRPLGGDGGRFAGGFIEAKDGRTNQPIPLNLLDVDGEAFVVLVGATSSEPVVDDFFN